MKYINFIKNRLSHHVLFIALLVFLLLNAVYLYNVNQKVSENTKIKKDVVALLLINKKLDLIFHKQMNFINYDNINKDMSDFSGIIDNIKNNKKLSIFFEDKYNRDLFKSVEEKYVEKKKTLKAFASANAVLNSSLRNLMSIFDEMMLRKVDKSRDLLVSLGKIHSSILQLKLGADVDMFDVKQNLKKQIKKATNRDAYNYLRYAKVVIKYLEIIQKEHEINEKLNFEDTLAKFRQAFDTYSTKIVNRLYTNMAIFLILIVLFVVAISMLLGKIKERTKNLFQFQQAIQSSDNTVVLTDKEHKILYVNDTFEATTGYTKKEALGQTPAILQSGLHDKEFYDDLKDKIMSGEGWTGEFANRRKDGKIIYEKASIYPMVNENEKHDGYLAIKLDITNEKNHLREIEAKNMEILVRYQIDDETGLWSKNVLEDELKKKTMGYLIYLRINNFEDIRFFYGTVTANEIIKKVAHNLKRFIAIYKISGQPFRLGDDDFCIWYKHKRPSKDMLEAINSYFKENPVELNNKTLHTTELYIGVSESMDLPQGDRLLQGMIAFYKAQKYALPYVYYEVNNELEREYRHNIIIAQRIRHALSKELVTVQCQPIYDTQTKEIYCYEVLMRMYDENGRMMYPGEFLEIAKQTALYTPLMHHVITLTFELLKAYPDMKFSMNMSVIDILDKDTSTLFTTLLNSCENPENIIIEVLESEGIENYDTIRPYLEEAKKKGCRVSIDDFGSGYSNYYRIMQLDIDHIKIDGSIIRELPYDKNSRVVVETIIGFAKRKGCKIVAEFVSNDEIYQEVKKYGIEYTQGYYLGKPVELSVK